MNPDRIRTFTRANRAAWDASAHLHGQGQAWDALWRAADRPGFNMLNTCLEATLNELGIAGSSAVQIGCNNARELLSLATLGAPYSASAEHHPHLNREKEYAIYVGQQAQLPLCYTLVAQAV